MGDATIGLCILIEWPRAIAWVFIERIHRHKGIKPNIHAVRDVRIYFYTAPGRVNTTQFYPSDGTHSENTYIPTVNSDNNNFSTADAETKRSNRRIIYQCITEEQRRISRIYCRVFAPERFKKARRTIEKTYHTNRLNNLKCKNKYRHHRQSQTKKSKLFSYLGVAVTPTLHTLITSRWAANQPHIVIYGGIEET